MATSGEGPRSLESVKERLDKDYSSDRLAVPYDPDAFDSMAVMNSELWNLGEGDEGCVTSTDLLPNGPDCLSPDDLRTTFLKAAQTGVMEVIRDLYSHCGPELLTVRDEDQYTPLHRASYNGHAPVVEFLLARGAEIEARTVDGWQPLHCACRWNKVEVASLLLRSGASINAQTNGGQTPLHLASSNDRAKSTLELLLSHPEVDAELLNGQGEAARAVAERNGRFAYLFSMVQPSIDHRRFLRDM